VEAKYFCSLIMKVPNWTKAAPLSMAALFTPREQINLVFYRNGERILFNWCLPSHFPMSFDRRKFYRFGLKFGIRFGGWPRQFPHIFLNAIRRHIRCGGEAPSTVGNHTNTHSERFSITDVFERFSLG